jgi:hypothetical protein
MMIAMHFMRRKYAQCDFLKESSREQQGLTTHRRVNILDSILYIEDTSYREK